MSFTSDYNSRYIEAVKLAKSLGYSQSDVPMPFALNEIEDFIAKLENERAARQAEAKEKESAKRPQGA
jgi:hypothetical protein